MESIWIETFPTTSRPMTSLRNQRLEQSKSGSEKPRSSYQQIFTEVLLWQVIPLIITPRRAHVRSYFEFSNFNCDRILLPVLSSFRSSRTSPTPDDDVFKHLSAIYSFNHRTMHKGLACPDGLPGFTNGTTNGALWYPLIGEWNNKIDSSSWTCFSPVWWPWDWGMKSLTKLVNPIRCMVTSKSWVLLREFALNFAKQTWPLFQIINSNVQV